VAAAQWMSSDVDELGHQILADYEIVSDVLACNSEDSSDEEVLEESGVSICEAFDSLETTLHWLEQGKARLIPYTYYSLKS